MLLKKVKTQAAEANRRERKTANRAADSGRGEVKLWETPKVSLLLTQMQLPCQIPVIENKSTAYEAFRSYEQMLSFEYYIK